MFLHSNRQIRINYSWLVGGKINELFIWLTSPINKIREWWQAAKISNPSDTVLDFKLCDESNPNFDRRKLLFRGIQKIIANCNLLPSLVVYHCTSAHANPKWIRYGRRSPWSWQFQGFEIPHKQRFRPKKALGGGGSFNMKSTSYVRV